MSLPFFGAIADRYGTWRVLALGGLIYAAGLYLMATADSPTMLHIGGGVLVGLGVAAGSFSIVLAAFARHTPPEKRSIVFGIGTAAGSAGMFLFAPISQGLIDAYGWSDSLMIMAVMMLAVPLLAIPLHGSSHNAPRTKQRSKQSATRSVRLSRIAATRCSSRVSSSAASRSRSSPRISLPISATSASTRATR